MAGPAPSKWVLPTPPNSHLLETPRSVLKTQGRSFSSAHIDDKRDMICYDAGPVTQQVTLDYFFDYVLPPLHEKIDLTKVMRKLEQKEVIKNGRFALYPQDPASMAGREPNVFEPLQQVTIDIIDVVKSKKMKPTLRFLNKGYHVPISDIRPWDGKPDFFGVLLPFKKNQRPRWRSTAIPAELKPVKNDGKSFDNDRKMMGNLQHSLCDNIKRRFVYGFTIEDNEMKLWFASRQHNLISNPFNCMTDLDKTVRVILSFAFAPEHLLGFDPTIERTKDDTFFKVFTGPDEVRLFRMVELMFDKPTDTTNGSGIRIFKVQEVINGAAVGPFLTLKDSWVEQDQMPEGAVFQELSTAQPSDEMHKESVDEYFLPVLCYGDVQIEGQADNTEELMLRGTPVPPGSPRYCIVPPEKENKKANVDARGDHETPAEKRLAVSRQNMLPTRSSVPLVHRRIVYGEVGRPLWSETNAHSIFSHLCSICVAIQTLHEAGLLHRNLSTDTIVIDEAGRSRLMDMHDVKRINSINEAHPARYTSLDFMAVEIRRGKYRFKTENTTSEPSVAVHALRDNMATRRRGNLAETGQLTQKSRDTVEPQVPATTTTTANNEPPIRYNPLHDLESLWWIAVYFVLKREAISDGVAHPISRTIEDSVHELFTSVSDRYSFFISGEIMEFSSHVHPKLSSAVIIFNKIRVSLVNAYDQLERNLTQDVTVDLSDCKLYSSMGTHFMAIAASVGDILLQPRESSNPESSSPPSPDSTASADSGIPLVDEANASSTSQGQKRSRGPDEENGAECTKKLKST